MNKIKKFTIKHPILFQFVMALAVGFIFAVLYAMIDTIKDLVRYNSRPVRYLWENFAAIPLATVIVGIVVYPIIVTIYEIILVIFTVIKGEVYINKRAAALYDLYVILVGTALDFILLNLFNNVLFEKQWFEELRNQELHTPLSHEHMLTFFVLLLMFGIGNIILMADSDKRPPLVTVLGIAMMYIGIISATLFVIQISGMHLIGEDSVKHYKFAPDILFTYLVPFNMALMTVRAIFTEIRAYKPDVNRMSKIDGIPALKWCNKVLNDAKMWPAIAVIMMIPLLGIIIGVLALLGQAPDAAIKVFTETANYTFSTKIPPQNVFYDEHYLCTVAAGGHKKIVKPLRMGKRHGHDVIVNRQLCVANSFEQILEEKTPKAHRAIRDFYDKYGFPVARLIKSKYIADIIWFMMKPLEWIFLIVIYMVDINPEDRIYSQYL